MALRLELLPELLERLPALRTDQLETHGRKHVAERQQFIASLLCRSYSRRFPHKVEPGADCFSAEFLGSGLRCPRGYEPLLAPFYDFPFGSQGYSRALRLTKPYKLKPDVLHAVADVFEGDAPAPIVHDSGNGTEPVPLDKADLFGKVNLIPDLRPEVLVPRLLPLSVAQVSRALQRVEAWITKHGEAAPLDPLKPDSLTLFEARCMLAVIRKWVVSFGGYLPNFYNVAANGRCTPREGPPHLISTPKVLRRLLYEGTDIMDYDIVACHPSIFVSLGKHYSLDTSCVESYIENRAAWFTRFAAVSKLPPTTDFKPLVNSWFTGGSLSPSLMTESGRTYGKPAMRRLAKDERAVALRKEIATGMKWLLKHAAKWDSANGQRTLTNAVGCELVLKGKRGDSGRAYSHYLTGYEQFAIRQMCSRTASLQAVIYDGFIAKPLNTAMLEKHVQVASRQHFGFSLGLRLKAETLGTQLPYPLS